MTYLKSQLLEKVPGIIHGFGIADQPIPSNVAQAWERAQPHWKQVHQAHSCEVQSPGQECGEVDALYTTKNEIPIGIVTADCVPILMTDRKGQRIAAVHAGWRGTKARILHQVWEKLRKEGQRPSDWVAAIGPSIGPCCYEVSSELIQDFQTEYREIRSEWVAPYPRKLDLPWINLEELKRIGISEIDLIQRCTYCSVDPKFHSFRRDQNKQRQFSIIMRTPGIASANS